MNFRIDEAIALLDRTPGLLRTWLLHLPDAWVEVNEGGESFHARDVVGHLIDGEETDWLVRARHVLEHGAAVPFAPFDRFAFRDKTAGLSLSELLDRFETLRSRNLAALRTLGLSDDDLDLEGQHPDLGRVRVRELLSTWVAHDLSHIGQVARVMAKRYRDDVGPWRQYLPLLDR